MNVVFVEERILREWADIVRYKLHSEETMRPTVLLAKTQELLQIDTNDLFVIDPILPPEEERTVPSLDACVLVDESIFKEWAYTIRTKKGITDQMTPEELLRITVELLRTEIEFSIFTSTETFHNVLMANPITEGILANSSIDLYEEAKLTNGKGESASLVSDMIIESVAILFSQLALKATANEFSIDSDVIVDSAVANQNGSETDFGIYTDAAILYYPLHLKWDDEYSIGAINKKAVMISQTPIHIDETWFGIENDVIGDSAPSHNGIVETEFYIETKAAVKSQTPMDGVVGDVGIESDSDLNSTPSEHGITDAEIIMFVNSKTMNPKSRLGLTNDGLNLLTNTRLKNDGLTNVGPIDTELYIYTDADLRNDVLIDNNAIGIIELFADAILSGVTSIDDWEYPVLRNGVLTITQVYETKQTEEILLLDPEDSGTWEEPTVVDGVLTIVQAYEVTQTDEILEVV